MGILKVKWRQAENLTETEKDELIRNLLNLHRELNLNDFETYVANFIKRKHDKQLAIQELDTAIGLLANFILLLSVDLKQKYLLSTAQEQRQTPEESGLLTRQEVAQKFKVSRRTVSNWIYDGLKTTEIGGVIRISEEALQEFMKSHQTKKFNWASVGNRKKAA